MRKIKNILRKSREKLIMMGTTMMGSLILLDAKVMAASGTESIDSFINFACDWLTKIGGVIALVGGVMFALGWQREDAEGKSRGLMTLMAGFMLVAIAQSKNLFGL